jgi:hypothetical protein
MEINGLPLHVLTIHAAVVFGPLAGLCAIAYVALPSQRDRLRWVTLAIVLVATGAIWAAVLSGQDFLESDRFSGIAGSPAEKLILDHQELGERLRWVVSGFAVATVLAVWQHRRAGAGRYVLGALVVAGALATLVYTFLTGEAGSKAVWS